MSSIPSRTGQAAFETHDHTGCIARVMAAAEARCAEVGARLTPARRRVLEILVEEHRAWGAYDVLARLADEGHPAHPPVAYRALDFLVSHGLAHRIERLNAFVACDHPGERHRPAFLICRGCDLVAETHIPADAGPLGEQARAMGFDIEQAYIEAEGLCSDCGAAS